MNDQVKSSYLFQLAEKKQVKLYIAILSSILSGFMAMVPYIMLYQSLLVLFKTNGSPQKIFHYALISAISLIIRILLQGFSMALTHIGAYDLLYLIRQKLCGHLGEIELGYFTEHSTGEIKKILMEDVERLESFYAHQIPQITVAIVIPITLFIYMLTLNVFLACFMFVPILLNFIIQALEMVIAKPTLQGYPKIAARCNTSVLQFIHGMPVMKAYHMTADSYADYSESMEDYRQMYIQLAKILAPMSGVAKVITESGLLFSLSFGGYLYLKGRLSIDSLLFFIIISMVFLASFQNLLNFAQLFSQISSGLAQIKKVMELPALSTQSQIIPQNSGYEIKFEHVSFGYNKRKVLQDINLTIKPGTVTAFVGTSGAGKSTAAQLIARFWDVLEGEICINGVNIQSVSQEELMKKLSFVFQDAFLINDSIYNNIAIGQKNATKEQVESAAKAAQIHDFILSLPNGYNTIIGDSGVKLSGGEKQRICIARAILKDAPILIFDEATSFTDGENEYKIQQALSKLMKGKTVIMVAHRLHTIMDADQICVFEEGRVVEQGTHNELCSKGGKYANMWHTYIGRRTQA